MRRATLSVFFASLLLAAGAGLAGQKTREEHLAGELAKASTAARERKNPYDGRPEAIQAGQKLFRRHCAECHGPEARGEDKAPNLHSATIRDSAPGTLFWFLRNGNLKQGMPSWSRLPDERLWQIVTYLKNLN